MTNTNLAEKIEDTIYGTTEELGTENLGCSSLNYILKVRNNLLDNKNDISQIACNDNFEPDKPTDPTNQQKLATLFKQKEEFAKKLEACKKMAQSKGLSKEVQEEKFQAAFKASEDHLRCELKIAEIFKLLPTNPGHRSELEENEGIQTKCQFIESEYGIPYITAWRISKLTPECVEKAIEYAKKYKEPPTRRLALLLLRQSDMEKLHSDLLIQKAQKKLAQKQKRKEAEQAKIQREIEDFNAMQSPLPNINPGETYNVIYVDPSVSQKTFDELKSFSIPASENSVLFIWSLVKNLSETLDLMSTWGFAYQDSGVWDRMDNSRVNPYFQNQHDLLLIGIKGSGLEPHAREKSICRIPLKEGESRPEYYKELIKTMYPAEVYLDVLAQINGKEA